MRKRWLGLVVLACFALWQCDSDDESTPREEPTDGGPKPDAGGTIPDTGTSDADDGSVQLARFSNGVLKTDLDGVTAPLTAAAGATIVVSSDDGSIALVGSAPIRAAGEGVVGGIGFVRRNGLAILAVQAFDVGTGARVEIVGNTPLALLSRGDVTIAGVIDVSAGRCADAGADPGCGGPGGGAGAATGLLVASGCAPGGNATGDAGGGGGGGGFATAGAGGATNATQPAADGGAPNAQCSGEALEPLRGGSGGGGGALATTGATTGNGGGGGGALQISSPAKITITGAGNGIRASGGGGAGGSGGVGGGGAGSGGAILLEGTTVSVGAGAILAANGGGGGGAGGTGGAKGEPGNFGDGRAFGGGAPLDGGTTMFAYGGRAGSASVPSEVGGYFTVGISGGGGGAGVGRIRINAASSTPSLAGAIVSPPASIGAFLAP